MALERLKMDTMAFNYIVKLIADQMRDMMACMMNMMNMMAYMMIMVAYMMNMMAYMMRQAAKVSHWWWETGS